LLYTHERLGSTDTGGEPRTRDQLSDAEFRALVGVLMIGPCTSRELEEHLRLRKSAVYRYLTKLRGAGLVIGEKDVEPVGHRPAFRFRVTDAGAGYLEAINVEVFAESAERKRALERIRS
jgi:predicted transcriptional regulator